MAGNWESLVAYGVTEKPRVTTPTLFIDAHYPSRIETELRAALPDLNIEVTEGLGHFPQLEDAGLVNRLIEGFVAVEGKRIVEQ
jgi:pimeloyl-ACP methyl ester carboxylesterase